jgi:DNA-binding protein Fis
MPWLHFKLVSIKNKDKHYAVAGINSYVWKDEDDVKASPSQTRDSLVQYYAYDWAKERNYDEMLYDVVGEEVDNPPLDVLEKMLKRNQRKIIELLEVAEIIENSIEREKNKT